MSTDWSTIALYEENLEILKASKAQCAITTDKLQMKIIIKGKTFRFSNVDTFNGFCQALEIFIEKDEATQ